MIQEKVFHLIVPDDFGANAQHFGCSVEAWCDVSDGLYERGSSYEGREGICVLRSSGLMCQTVGMSGDGSLERRVDICVLRMPNVVFWSKRLNNGRSCECESKVATDEYVIRERRILVQKYWQMRQCFSLSSSTLVCFSPQHQTSVSANKGVEKKEKETGGWGFRSSEKITTSNAKYIYAKRTILIVG